MTLGLMKYGMLTLTILCSTVTLHKIWKISAANRVLDL